MIRRSVMLALALLVLLLPALAPGPVHAAPPDERPYPWHEIGEDGSLRVNLYVFWSETCPHCHRALRFLGNLEEELPWLDIAAFEVAEPGHAELYARLAEELGTEARYVPAFFYCGEFTFGYDDDTTTGRFRWCSRAS